jgi:hypothetical protein
LYLGDDNRLILGKWWFPARRYEQGWHHLPRYLLTQSDLIKLLALGKTREQRLGIWHFSSVVVSWGTNETTSSLLLSILQESQESVTCKSISARG